MNKPILTNNTIRVKESNTNLVITTLQDLNSATCMQISKATGLSVATCGNLIKKLLKDGLVLEGELENNNAGRPARKYIYNKNYSMVIALTIRSESNTKFLQYAISNLTGEVMEERMQTYDSINSDVIVDLIGKLMDKYPNIQAAGIGVPGIVDKNGCITKNDIEELNGINFVNLLSEKYNLKVGIDRSPAISVYGYYSLHPELSGKIVAAILSPIDKPTGAGFVIGNQIYKGSFNMEGELGYVSEGFVNSKLDMDEEDKTLIHETIFNIAAIISTINPSILVFMGKRFNEENVERLYQHCQSLFTDFSLPEFVVLENYNDEYLHGTIQIAIDCLSPKIKLISS